ncbi:MAG: CBASS oligonucleotide cyclase [Oscillospiraceae bacterium]
MSGGGGFGGYRSIGTSSQLSSSTSGAQASQHEIEMNEFLEDLLKDYNKRDVAAIRTHLNEIEKVLGREIEGLDRILFGGSISKNTFIEGASDVDALVILDRAKYKDATPKELQNAFAKMLQQRFPRTEIKCGSLAVTIKYKDYEIQLLPALRNNGKLQIASNDGACWSTSINSAKFTEKLTATNKMNSNKVVPVIKLAKSLLSNLPSKYQLSGYHVEALAVDAFSTYNGRCTLYDMTMHFLNYSTKRVLTPMSDVTGQSGIIDDNLGIARSITRQKLSGHIKDIAGRFLGATSDAKKLFD